MQLSNFYGVMKKGVRVSFYKFKPKVSCHLADVFSLACAFKLKTNTNRNVPQSVQTIIII